jgi:hypothetical protein
LQNKIDDLYKVLKGEKNETSDAIVGNLQKENKTARKKRAKVQN